MEGNPDTGERISDKKPNVELLEMRQPTSAHQSHVRMDKNSAIPYWVGASAE